MSPLGFAASTVMVTGKGSAAGDRVGMIKTIKVAARARYFALIRRDDTRSRLRRGVRARTSGGSRIRPATTRRDTVTQRSQARTVAGRADATYCGLAAARNWPGVWPV